MMNRILADRMQLLGTESAFEVLQRANKLQSQGMEVIHLEIGEPDFDTSPNVISSAVKAMNKGQTKYCPPAGLPQLRECIAKVSGEKRGLSFKPEEVVVTPGAKPILFFALQACVNPGDEVILPDPGFPIYDSAVGFCGGIPKPVPIIEKDDNFTLDLDILERSISPKTKAVILNSPHNPTGGIIPEKDLQIIASLVRDKDILIISDEIYSDIYYEEKPVSIASFPGMKERTVIVDGFSKSYAMTGWRLGYGIMPQTLAEHFAKLAVNTHSCTPPFVQLAGLEALQNGQDSLQNMVREFKARRDILVEGLRKIPGFRCPTPRGAFYAFPNVDDTGYDSSALADKLLNEGGVATLEGSSFGAAGKGYLRLSYVNSQENIYRAIEKIEKVILNNRKKQIM